MRVISSLIGKSVQVINGNFLARRAYMEVLRPFLKAGAKIGYHASPTSFLARLKGKRPLAMPDMLIVGPWFTEDMQSHEFVGILRRRGFAGTSFIGSAIAYRINEHARDLQVLVQSRLTCQPADLSPLFIVKDSTDVRA